MSNNKYTKDWPHKELPNDVDAILDEMHKRICKVSLYLDLIIQLSDDPANNEVYQMGELADSSKDKLYGFFDLYHEVTKLREAEKPPQLSEVK